MPLIDAVAVGSHSIHINGIEQRYHVAGQGPLCIVHPGGSGVDWAYLKMPEVEQHLTLVYIEAIGTGASGRLPGHPEGYSVECYSHQLEGLVDALDLADFFLLGHSQGGLVIQQYAIAHPDKVAGIIIYDGSAVARPEFMNEAGQNVVAFARRETGSPGDDKPFDARETLPKLRIPALILASEQNFVCGPKWAEILHTSLPGSQLVIFRLGGHMAHIEQPVAFAGIISAFVFRNRDGGARRRPFRGKLDKITKLLN